MGALNGLLKVAGVYQFTIRKQGEIADTRHAYLQAASSSCNSWLLVFGRFKFRAFRLHTPMNGRQMAVDKRCGMPGCVSIDDGGVMVLTGVRVRDIFFGQRQRLFSVLVSNLAHAPDSR
jgi:hypothetical protein